jgi:hypothetical protein
MGIDRARARDAGAGIPVRDPVDVRRQRLDTNGSHRWIDIETAVGQGRVQDPAAFRAIRRVPRGTVAVDKRLQGFGIHSMLVSSSRNLSGRK